MKLKLVISVFLAGCSVQ